jgi:hypothetical protein
MPVKHPVRSPGNVAGAIAGLGPEHPLLIRSGNLPPKQRVMQSNLSDHLIYFAYTFTVILNKLT